MPFTHFCLLFQEAGAHPSHEISSHSSSDDGFSDLRSDYITPEAQLVSMTKFNSICIQLWCNSSGIKTGLKKKKAKTHFSVMKLSPVIDQIIVFLITNPKMNLFDITIMNQEK